MHRDNFTLPLPEADLWALLLPVKYTLLHQGHITSLGSEWGEGESFICV
jgi:hypothetical protein